MSQRAYAAHTRDADHSARHHPAPSARPPTHLSPQMQQASSALFSLGGAIWGFTPAAGHASPQQQQVPDAWLLILIEKHADAEFFLCLFTASRGSRDWVLVNAPRAVLSFRSDCRPWPGQFITARRGLLTRGAKPVCVRIEAPRAVLPACMVHNTATLFLLGAFQWFGHGVRQLSLEWGVAHRPRRRGFWPDLLSKTAAAWSQLSARLPRCLQVASLLPSHMPQLRELSVTNLSPSDPTCGNIAQHLSQLTSLSIQDHYRLNLIPVYTNIFTPATPSTTLVKFSTSTILCDELLSLLLDKTPSLQDLTVDES